MYDKRTEKRLRQHFDSLDLALPAGLRMVVKKYMQDSLRNTLVNIPGGRPLAVSRNPDGFRTLISDYADIVSANKEEIKQPRSKLRGMSLSLFE